MRIAKLECKNCGAVLEVNLDTFQGKCPHCNSEYLIESKALERSFLEKEKTKRHAITELTEAQKAKHSWKNDLVKSEGFYAFFAMCILSLLGILLGLMITLTETDWLNIKKLELIEHRITSNVDDHNYEKALFFVNQLNLYNSLKSKDNKKTWKEKQDYYFETIPILKREFDLSDPNNLLAPLSSKQLSGKTGQESFEIFNSAGFTNLKLIEVQGSAGLFKKKNLVEHISFGDKTKFTTDDYINKNDPIIIYYYSN